MGKRNRIVATYRSGEHLFQANVDCDNAYPEALAVARANARELVCEMVADIMELDVEAEMDAADAEAEVDEA
ncbi:hypothetical protein [uncultured Arthrobacter sp.]|uniref:hypothetical protein n=1 Tax=uncultured Arthrobacter sp. TaxID=114050 RepID=UPI0025D36BB4|nr:hypothetical protein [uncultured Arthrobacter sp.]